MSVNSYLQQHEMRLEKTHPSGAQEWACSICGRRFIVQWQPQPNIVDLETGDPSVSHMGGTGDLRLRPPRIGQSEDPVLSDELRTALEEALEDIDLDDWLNMADND